MVGVGVGVLVKGVAGGVYVGVSVTEGVSVRVVVGVSVGVRVKVGVRVELGVAVAAVGLGLGPWRPKALVRRAAICPRVLLLSGQ